MIKKFDVIIIGAGASGFSCAYSSIQRGKSVALLEHGSKSLQKVFISGGGKCNFTNLEASKNNYMSENKNFCISSLKQFSPYDMLDLVNKHKIKFYEKAPNQLFCSESSMPIIEMLKKETQLAEVFYNITLENIAKIGDEFHIQTKQALFVAKSLVIATGGVSYPALGASDSGYQIAKQFGHKIVPYRPALVPFNLNNEIMKETINLKGIAIPSIVTVKNKAFRDNILFTHFGLSGPAILQASLYWDKADIVTINLLPDVNLFEYLKSIKNSSGNKKISSILKQYFPEKFIKFLLSGSDYILSEVSNKVVEKLCGRVNNWQIEPIGTQGMRLAEVTKGGVDVNQVSSQTLESKIVSNLFFIGEVLDVTGELGGYNLQWAWSSGFTAGKYV